MDRSSNKKFQVFEFNVDENGVERYNYKFNGGLGARRTKKKRDDDSPITKYHFLQSFAGGTKIRDQGRGEPIDVDVEVVQDTKKAQKEDSTASLGMDASDRSLHCKSPVMYPNTRPPEVGPVKVDRSRMDASIHKIRPFATVPSEIISTEATCSETCTPKNQVPLEKQLIGPDCGGCEIDDENMTVKIFPGLILYQDLSLGESCLTFTCNDIKLEGSTLNGTGKTFCSEWTIRDVRKIESDWNASVETAMVCLHLRSKKSKESGTANKMSGVEQLIFAVYDPDWSKGQEAIKTLDRRYKDKWNIEIDMVSSEKELWSGDGMFSPKKHFSSSDKPFQDVIYPKGDPDAVIIHKRDIELLEPERFINDTIIDFYVKYLERNFQSEEKHRFHFFNSFFFRKLADLDKDRSSANEGKVAFQRVHKWTRKVDLFRKDYIFIPVNYSFHWSLLVICYPGEVLNLQDEESESVSKVPYILHMDSIRGSHKGLKNLIQSYLCEEWKERHNNSSEDASSKFLQMKFVPLELPQQENLFDCGLFLLHYVERFLKEVPPNFSPFNFTKSSTFLSRNWFLPKEASLKRYRIKKLIYEIFEDQSRNMPSADSIDRNTSMAPSETCDQETEVIFLERISGPKAHGISSSVNAKEVGGSLSESRGDLGFRKSGLVTSELSEQGACSSSYTGANYLQSPAPLQGSTTLPIEEDEEIDEQVAESPFDMRDSEEEAEFKLCQKHKVYSFLDSPLDTDERVSESPLVVEDSEEGQSTKQREVSEHIRKHDKWVSVCEASSGSPTSLGIGAVDVIQRPQEIKRFEKDKVACVVSNLDKELADCVVRDSNDDDSENDGNKVRCFRLSKRRLRKRSVNSKVPIHSR